MQGVLRGWSISPSVYDILTAALAWEIVAMSIREALCHDPQGEDRITPCDLR
jgi:hypothetical protein